MLINFFGYTKGSGFGVLEDREIKLDVGETFIARAGTLHSLRSGGGSEGHEFEATCTDCHMPSQYHVFKIDITSPSDNPKHLSKDGKYFKPWLTAEKSCKGCHDDFDEVAAQIKKVHK